MNVPELAGLDTANQASMLVAKKQLDAARDQGAAVVKLIQAAAEATPSRQGSVSPVAADGSVDIYA